MLLQEKGVEDIETYLIRNPKPYTVGPRDVAPVANDTIRGSRHRIPRWIRFS
ncbi:hypothetical protein DPMN_091896 [Dreissena polymorpha]|uniref:Uncharacterized protein n=1 Tax=Dreissena polymorpha TaxID=45954 RepID=A0A9D4R0D1_DREPO|nr:hypothetical protein DPMN_091896 [Dreissena polymorpha]